MARGVGIIAPKITFGEMLDEVLPRLHNPVTASFDYWREHLGGHRLRDVTTEVIERHRDLLLGAPCRGHNHRTARPRSTQTVRNYLVELSRAYVVAIRTLRLCDSNPVSNVNKPAASRKIVRFLADDEKQRLLAACRASVNPDLYGSCCSRWLPVAARAKSSN